MCTLRVATKGFPRQIHSIHIIFYYMSELLTCVLSLILCAGKMGKESVSFLSMLWTHCILKQIVTKLL